MITFDHIAVTALSLAEGAAHVHAATGLTLPKGGEHPQMGTHNLLTTFGDDSYFEIITQNPTAPAPDRPRWFGLDKPPEAPHLAAWLLRTDDIERDIAAAATVGVDLGRATPLKRDALRWRFSLRDDGALPLDGAAPVLIQWDTEGPHPSRNMTDLGLRLDSLLVETPHTEQLTALLDVLGLQQQPRLHKSDLTRLTAHLTLPDGKKAVLR